MSRRPAVRTTRLPPLLRVVLLHDQIAASLSAETDRDRAHRRTRGELSAWRVAIGRLAHVDVAMVLPHLAEPLPVDRRGRVRAS